MNEQHRAKAVYSTQFQLIGSEQLAGWCVHAVCLRGEASFSVNGRAFHVQANNAVVVNDTRQVKVLGQSGDLRVELLAAPLAFLASQLPGNNYGIGGGISLYDNPVIPLSEEDAGKLVRDMHNIRDRMDETGHLFYQELMGGLVLPLMYDLFCFHAKSHRPAFATHRSLYVVKELLNLLEAGCCKKHREVAYYARRLNVTPKYLSNTIRRQTGKSATYYIDRYTVPLVKEYLDNPKLSIEQIADEMNFSSSSYFSRYVSKHLGLSPKAYRASLIPR